MLWGMTADNKCGKYFASGEERLRIVTPDAMGRCSCCKVDCNKGSGILNHLVGSSWHTWDAVLLQQTFLCNPSPQVIWFITMLRIFRSLKEDTKAWTNCDTEAFLSWLKGADGIRQVLALSIALAFWENRRYFGT